MPTLGDDDPIYAGWTRLGFVERWYRPDPARPHRPPVEEVTVLSGAVAVPLGTTIPPEAFPFKDGDVDDWWCPDPPPTNFPLRFPRGQLVRLAHASDWLGSALVLVPPAFLYGYLGLEPALYGGPLLWRDTKGNAAVALRTWWVRNPDALFTESAACEGADLIMRSDLVERVIPFFGIPLRELCVVLRRVIPNVLED